MIARVEAPAIALATCREVPGLLDEEGELLRATLAARGARVDPAVWDDAGVDWAGYDLVVVRSTWDYPRRVAEFLAWSRRVAAVTALLNGPEPLGWSADKHYLAELAAAGVPIVPSAFLEPGAEGSHGFLDVEHVVKPTISAGSRDTLRLGPDDHDRSRAHARALLDAGRSVLVQPYLEEVDTVGETAVVAIDGVVSHAARKGALLSAGADLVEGLFAEEQMSACEVTVAEREVTDTVLGFLAERFPTAGPLLYARVDLLPSLDGPLVLECELAEPSLFLPYADGAADRFADAILARLPST